MIRAQTPRRALVLVLRRALRRALAPGLLLAAACGDDGGATAGSTTTATASTGASEGSTTGGDASSSGAGSSSGGGSSGGATSTGADTTTGGDTSSSGGETTGGGLCDRLPAGPFTPELVGSPFDGSEDVGFDGAGGLAGKLGDAVVIVDAALAATPLATPVDKAYGLRFMADGDLAVALPNAGKVLRITPEGTISDLITGLQSPNGLFPDLDGDLWITDFAASKVLRWRDGVLDEIVSGPEANSANGVVFDPDRGLLFYTNYGSGRIARVPIDGGGQPGAPATVAMIDGRPDGLALDACGNLYAVDQMGSRLFRIWLDDAGAALGDPELLATFPTNVANAQFGRGPGWDAASIYAAGNPGDVYRLAVGVAGAPIP